MPLHLGKDRYFFHYMWENIHKIGKNKAIFGLGMPPVTGGKNWSNKITEYYYCCKVLLQCITITIGDSFFM